MNKSLIAILGIIALGVAGFLFFSNGDNTNATANVAAAEIDGNIQRITLGIKNFNYYPQTIKVKNGIPVEITLDESVGGCYRSFTIPAFNIEEFSNGPEDKIVFTPTEIGTFSFACSMGMGKGTIIVE